MLRIMRKVLKNPKTNLKSFIKNNRSEIVYMKSLFIVSILFFCLSSNAQISLGGKAGISIPNLKGNNEKSKGYTSRLDVYGGIAGNFQLTTLLSLQPEINFSPQGGQRKGMQQVPSPFLDRKSVV